MKTLQLEQTLNLIGGISCSEAIADFMEDGSLANFLRMAEAC